MTTLVWPGNEMRDDGWRGCQKLSNCVMSFMDDPLSNLFLISVKIGLIKAI